MGEVQTFVETEKQTVERDASEFERATAVRAMDTASRSFGRRERTPEQVANQLLGNISEDTIETIALEDWPIAIGKLITLRDARQMRGINYGGVMTSIYVERRSMQDIAREHGTSKQSLEVGLKNFLSAAAGHYGGSINFADLLADEAIVTADFELGATPERGRTRAQQAREGKQAIISAVLSESHDHDALPEATGEHHDLDWQDDGLCAQTDPEAFFPEKGGSTRDAKKICTTCEVKAQCLEYALKTDQRFGIWGGLSERERRALKKRRAAAAEVAA
jgi:WhiB family transcriptional regulator, redox-sensing transcriptional regulator